MATKLATIIADFSTQLTTQIAIGGTTATLASATDSDGVALPAGRYFFTLDSDNSQKEHISCDISGTAVTNIKSISRQGAETTGCVRLHRVGAKVIISDFGHIKYMNDLVKGTTGFDSSSLLGYDGAPTGLAGNNFATVTYVLSVVSGGTVAFDQQVVSNQTAGETLAVNELVYFKAADQRWWKVDADLTATFDTMILGFTKTAGIAGTTITVAISGPVSGFSGLTPGSKYYASNTAGSISTTAGTNSVYVGTAYSASILFLDFVSKTLPTQKEKDAMGGSTGVPSSTNKFITQDNVTTASTDQTQVLQDSSSTVGEANTTGLRNFLAQSFTPTVTKIRAVSLYKSASTGTFTGTVTVSLQADSSGSPSGTALATVTLTNFQWVSAPVGEILCTFTSEYGSMTAGSLYWIVIQTSTSDTSNHPNIGISTTGGYANGSAKYKNTTDGWVAISTIDLYFKTWQGTASQVVKTNTSGKIDSSLLSIPTPYGSQTFGAGSLFGANEPDNVPIAFGSNQSGTVFYFLIASTLTRWAIDTTTGTYYQTHAVSFVAPYFVGPKYGSIVEIGQYIYIFIVNGSAVVICNRFLASDLTGSTSMSVPTISVSSQLSAWSDGTSLYITTDSTPTTCRKWSLSGTTFSAVSTVTCDGTLYSRIPMNDGTNIYLASRSTSQQTVYKLSDVDGSSSSIVLDRNIGAPGANGVNGFLININSTLMYMLSVYPTWNATVIDGSVALLTLVPKL